MTIGNTPQKFIKNVWGKFGAGKNYIKDESKNHYGTFKDRRNLGVLQEATTHHVDKLVLITSGNNGYSLCQLNNSMSKNSIIKIVCVIDKNMEAKIKKILNDCAYQIFETNLQQKIMRPEEVISFARENDTEVIWDVTNGYVSYYQPLITEILSHNIPDYIVVPIGSGGLFVELAEEIEKRKIKTRLIGLGTQLRYNSYADKLCTPWTPHAKAMVAYNQLGHFIYQLEENEIKTTYKNFSHLCDCEPSSCIVFAAPMKHHFTNNDTVVFINTGQLKVNRNHPIKKDK